MDIDKLEAGPELDSLIATTVLGWKLSEPSDDERGPAWLNAEGRVMGFQPDGRPPFDWDMPYFHPSTEISSAWEVVEHLKLSLIPTNTGWIVSQHHLFEGPIGEAPDAPLAICRAALKAVQGIIL